MCIYEVSFERTLVSSDRLTVIYIVSEALFQPVLPHDELMKIVPCLLKAL